MGKPWAGRFQGLTAPVAPGLWTALLAIMIRSALFAYLPDIILIKAKDNVCLSVLYGLFRKYRPAVSRPIYSLISFPTWGEMIFSLAYSQRI